MFSLGGDDQVLLPSEPHCLARLCEQLEQTFAALPSNLQQAYAKPLNGEDEPSPSSSVASLTNESSWDDVAGVGELSYRRSVQESMEDYPVQPIANRLLCQPTGTFTL